MGCWLSSTYCIAHLHTGRDRVHIRAGQSLHSAHDGGSKPPIAIHAAPSDLEGISSAHLRQSVGKDSHVSYNHHSISGHITRFAFPVLLSYLQLRHAKVAHSASAFKSMVSFRSKMTSGPEQLVLSIPRLREFGAEKGQRWIDPSRSLLISVYNSNCSTLVFQ